MKDSKNISLTVRERAILMVLCDDAIREAERNLSLEDNDSFKEEYKNQIFDLENILAEIG